MTNSITTILYSALIIGLPLIFSINGFGVTTWQWWALFLGIFIGHILGMIRMVD